ncbi:MAG: TonB-dependent receptor [Bacteroidales bacterium]|nr:TonB-dependent receptor [Bacteroidales bacterium]
MIKKALLFITAVLSAATLFAQSEWGGIKGTVVNRAGRTPIADAALTLSQSGQTVAEITTDADGKFLIENIPNGIYDMEIVVGGFIPAHVNVTVEGYIKDLIFVGMVAEQVVADVDDSSFAEFDMDDSGFEDAPSILFGSTDPFNNIASFGFSSIRFKNRGYTSESQDVYLSGVKMNDAITGYSPYSLWSGLNEAMRSKETTIGTESSAYGPGGYNGVTNIHAMPSSVRPGWRFSALTNSALYRLRLMATYASGELDNGWSYAFNVSARVGGNDWVKGVYYRSFAYYAGVEKKFDDVHRLSLVTFATPGQRGAQNASTQEVYDLMGDNMYNSNWGYHYCNVRNARVSKTLEPLTILKYNATPSDNLEANAVFLWRTGKNGYTALDWYDAPDPRPDYYRNLPSYFYMDDEDYDRQNYTKFAWATEAWRDRSGTYANYQHINWDALYNVNYLSGRSKYVLEERRVDQNDLNLTGNIKWTIADYLTLMGGINLKYNRTNYYKIIDDLLGGEYYLNIDSFAERDFASDPTKIQNDLDYYLKHGEAQKIYEGDRYGYDYLAHVRDARAWGKLDVKKGGLDASLALEFGYNSFWRDGQVRKGLFPDNSFGKSDVAEFWTGLAKLSLGYSFAGGHRVYANAAYISDAPTFNQSFISPRTRNDLVPRLTTTKTMSADINYRYSSNGYDFRITGFWTNIMDQTDMMSFYDDSQNSFTNFAMTGIDQRHAGIEMGFKIPFFLQGLSLQGAFSWGEYIYTSTPHMTQTIDNSAEIIVDNKPVTYWKSHPIYKRTMLDGEEVIDMDADGYIVEKEQKHYVPSTPQMAAQLGFNYRTRSYWFFELNAQYFRDSYLDMNPLYRTDMAVSGPDGIASPYEIEYMAAQEKFDPVFLLNASIGKSWYIDRKYNFGFSLNIQNITNNRNVKTGGYEQTRLIDSAERTRYYRFDSKYFYMQGINYMLNLYFRF